MSYSITSSKQFPPTAIEVEVEPAEAETNVGLPLRDNADPLASVSVSETIKLVNDTFPVLDIVIEYVIISPLSF